MAEMSMLEIKNGDEITVVDLGKLSRSQLSSLMLSIQQDMDAIRTQIETAKRSAAANGVYTDRDWLRRAEQALRIKGRQVQAIQNTLGERKRQQSRGLAEHFMDVARLLLDRDVFQHLLQEAMDRHDEQQANHISS